MMKRKTLTASIFAVAIAACGGLFGQAWAWGDTGHRIVGEEAMRALPPGLPKFLYTATAIGDVGQYSREPDLWRKSGTVHDSDRDPAHLMELDDDGKTLAGLSLEDLPPTRLQYEAALQAHGADPAKTGYLLYSLADAYEQVAKDFAYIRLIALAEIHEKDKAKLAWLKGAQRRREDLTLRDIGILSHYAGDATQPMHVSIHYNGWGDFPNPEGFTTASIHWPLEADYVRTHVDQASVRARINPLSACADKVETCMARRLERNHTQVIPLYRLEKAGGFKDGDPRGAPFMTGLLAQGASDLRDMISDAWNASATTPINFAGQTCKDAEAGRIADLYLTLYGDS